MSVMVFYIDAGGHRRGWARGPENDVDAVRKAARAKLDAWIERENEAGGDWSSGDFEEFVANVRETS